MGWGSERQPWGRKPPSSLQMLFSQSNGLRHLLICSRLSRGLHSEVSALPQILSYLGLPTECCASGLASVLPLFPPPDGEAGAISSNAG